MSTNTWAASLAIVEIAFTAFFGYHFYWYNTDSPTTIPQTEVEFTALNTIKWL